MRRRTGWGLGKCGFCLLIRPACQSFLTTILSAEILRNLDLYSSDSNHDPPTPYVPEQQSCSCRRLKDGKEHTTSFCNLEAMISLSISAAS